MAPFQPLPRKPMALMLFTTAILCIMAVELLGSKKVPPCCAAPRTAAHGFAGSSAAAAGLGIPPAAIEPNRFLPITPAAAEQINDNRPLAGRPLQPPPPTYLPTSWDALARQTARRCLAAAVYYEAAGEGWRGELGVAQVVLNRVRHPAYPKTICGVVYQGSNLPTGCQFTFTCDGRLAHPPSSAGWKQAEAVADAALSGRIEPLVGMSTHYHTRSVVPYWAGSLDKLAVLGNHIFYTFAGAAGNRRAFSGHILADAAPPGTIPLQADASPVGVGPVDAGVALATASSLPATFSRLIADTRTATQLIADQRGTLAAANGTLLQPDAETSRLRSDEGLRPR